MGERFKPPILTDASAVRLVSSRPDLVNRVLQASGRTTVVSNHALTARMKELLDFIREYSSQEGYSPSFDEMKVALGLKSKSGVHRLLSSLEERGFIVRLPNRARSIALVEQVAA